MCVCVCVCMCVWMNEEVDPCKYMWAQSLPTSRHLLTPIFAAGRLSSFYLSPYSMVYVLY